MIELFQENNKLLNPRWYIVFLLCYKSFFRNSRHSITIQFLKNFQKSKPSKYSYKKIYVLSLCGDSESGDHEIF